MTKKSLPNIFTGLRIALTGLLVLLPIPGKAFMLVYIACGLTDILDGWLARKLNAASIFGARLDSAADFFFICVLLMRILPIIKPGLPLVLWTVIIATIRILSAVVTRLRFGTFGFVHTWANKATGLIVFLCPLLLSSEILPGMLYIACAVATLSAVEELIIALIAKVWDPDRASIFNSAPR